MRSVLSFGILLIIGAFSVVVVSSFSIVQADQKEVSMKIAPEIITGQGLKTNYVGDYFWYRIHLENNSTSTIAGTFTVKVYNTTHGLLYPVGDYVRSLKPTEKTEMYPNYTREGREEYSIFFFSSPGTYELDVSSSVPIAFYQYFPDGKYIVQHSLFRFYFDALPASERVLNDKMQAWIQENEQNVIEEAKSTRTMLVLTEVMFLVTVINTSLVVWSTRAQQHRRVNLLFYIYVGILLTFVILIMLRVPIFFFGE